MLIINADFPSGMTIDEAIRESVDFSERMGCMVRVSINDVPMTIVSGLPNPEREGCRMTTEESVKYFKWVYTHGLSMLDKNAMK